MKTTAYAALICSAALLAGCISVPEPTILHMSELRNKDFGRYPDNYQAIIKRRLAETLIDPIPPKSPASPRPGNTCAFTKTSKPNG